jgi:hypothetical protein
VASSSKKSSTSKSDRNELLRRGVTRLIEQGRLMSMLGEGFSAALAACDRGWTPSDEDSLTNEVFGWIRRTMCTASPRGRSSQPEPRPAPATKNVQLLSQPALALMQGSLRGVNCPLMWVGSQEIATQWVTMALAAGVDGLRRVLALRPGSVREEGVAEELVSDLVRRGFQITRGLLVVTEGSRTLDRALIRNWTGPIQIAHCRTKLRSDILGHFPEACRSQWSDQLEAAWSLPPDESAAVLGHLESRWSTECPGAAERLGRSREASLVVARLDISSPLKERLESMGTLRMAFKQSMRWSPEPGLAGLNVGVPAWLQRSRRLVGWHRLELLSHILRGQHGPENNAAPKV